MSGDIFMRKLLLLLCMSAVSLFAQYGSGTILGTVTRLVRSSRARHDPDNQKP